jgi:hypothetical protein
MKTKIVEMYRESQYKSWEEAHNMGGVYSVEVPEDTPTNTIRELIYAASICKSADDPVAWRVKPVELIPFQQAFVRAYRDNVGVATPEQVDNFVREPSTRPCNMDSSEYYKLLEAHDMFVAGRASYAASL